MRQFRAEPDPSESFSFLVASTETGTALWTCSRIASAAKPAGPVAVSPTGGLLGLDRPRGITID